MPTNKVARNALALYGIQAAQYILPWLTFPYLARVLRPEKWGLLLFAQAFIQYFLVITEYGFNFTATRDVSIHRHDNALLRRVFSSVMAARALLLGGSFLLMVAIVLAVPSMRAQLPLFCITFLGVLGQALFPSWLYQGLEEMQYITVREIGARLIGLLPTFLLVRGEGDYLIAAAVQSGSGVLAGVAGLMAVPKLTGVWFTRVSVREIRHALSDGWHVFLSTAAINLYTRSNMVVLGLLATPVAVASFGNAQKLADAGKSLVFPLSMAIYPHIARLAYEGSSEALAFIRRNTIRLALPFGAMTIALMAGAPLIVRILFGTAYPESVALLRIMAPIPLVVSISVSFATYFMLGLGYKKEWSRMILQAGLFNFIVLIPLIFWLGATYAVAWTSLLAECFVLVRSYAFYRRKQA